MESLKDIIRNLKSSAKKHVGKCCHKNRIIRGALDLEEREMVQDNYLDG